MSGPIRLWYNGAWVEINPLGGATGSAGPAGATGPAGPAGPAGAAGVVDALGNISLDGVLSLGAKGGIYQGTGAFASPITGLKVWNSGGIGKIAGYNATVAQWYADTDGKLYAGAGNTLIDANGVSVIPTDDWLNTRAYRFASGATVYGGLSGKIPAGFNSMRLYSTAIAGRISESWVMAEAASGQESKVILAVIHPDLVPSQVVVQLKASMSGFEFLIQAATIINDSLSVGTNPAASGIIRIPNNQWITARNAGNTGDVNIAKVNASNYIEIGDLGWYDWTPTVTQGVAVTATVVEAKYCLIGKVCTLSVFLNLTSAGTAGQRVGIGGLPAAAQLPGSDRVVGLVAVNDTGTTRYIGALYALSTSGFCVFVSGNQDQLGATPNYTIANGDDIKFTVTYRVA